MVRWLFATLEWKSESHRNKAIEYAMLSAASHGDLDSLQWLAELNPLKINAIYWSRHWLADPWRSLSGSGLLGCEADRTLGSLLLRAAAWRALEWFQEYEPEGYDASFAANDAVRCGRLDVLQWLHTTRSASLHDMFTALSVGCLPIVEFIYENERDWRTGNETQTAAMHGHLHTLKWLHQKGLLSRNLDRITSEGLLPIAKYLMTHLELGFTSAGVIDALKHKRFALVEWILRHDPAIMDGEPWPTTFFD